MSWPTCSPPPTGGGNRSRRQANGAFVANDFETVILSACRTPIGSFGGAFKTLSAVDLGAIVIREAIGRAHVKPVDVGDVVMGCVLQAGVGMNVARQAALKAGLPFEVPGETVNRVCGSGLQAVVHAVEAIRVGYVDTMVAGGTESPINRLAMAGFCSARALSTSFNDTPEKASRPYDKDRDGFVMGEGAGVVVLEEYEHARKRGAKIHAEIIGYGMSGDAYHITSPAPDGDGAPGAFAVGCRMVVGLRWNPARMESRRLVTKKAPAR